MAIKGLKPASVARSSSGILNSSIFPPTINLAIGFFLTSFFHSIFKSCVERKKFKCGKHSLLVKNKAMHSYVTRVGEWEDGWGCGDRRVPGGNAWVSEAAATSNNGVTFRTTKGLYLSPARTIAQVTALMFRELPCYTLTALSLLIDHWYHSSSKEVSSHLTMLHDRVH